MSNIPNATDSPDWTPALVPGGGGILAVDTGVTTLYNSPYVYVQHCVAVSLVILQNSGATPALFLVTFNAKSDGSGVNIAGPTYEPAVGTVVLDRIVPPLPYMSIEMQSSTNAHATISVYGASTASGPVMGLTTNILLEKIGVSVPLGATNYIGSSVIPGMAQYCFYSSIAGVTFQVFNANGGSPDALLASPPAAAAQLAVTDTICLSYGVPYVRVNNAGAGAAIIYASLVSTRGYT